MFVLGEGEEAVVELANLIRERKKTGTSKKQILQEISDKFDWAYVPCYLRVTSHETESK